jgi:5-methylcytosine-specific restriction endonuclease McrA
MCARHYENDYRRTVRRRRRNEWIASQGGCCAECGTTDYLQIDHVDPAAKSCEIEQIWFRTAARRVEELAKCQVLCRTCHEAKTKAEQLGPHGSLGRYRHGCRCAECSEEIRRRARDYRARQRAAA